MQVSIPGVTDNSGIDTNKLIEDLLEAERQPIIRTEEKIKDSEDKLVVWRDTNANMKLLEESAKKLYGFNSPFREKNAESSHPQLVEAQSSRVAITGEYGLTSKQIALADRWISQGISEEYDIPRGKYEFTIGDKEVSFDFSGNTLEELIDIINTQGKKKLKASIIKKGSGENSKIFLLEGLILGEEGVMSLSHVAETFAKDIKLLGADSASSHVIPLTTANIVEYMSDENLFVDQKGRNDKGQDTQVLHMYPGAGGKISVPSPLYEDFLKNENATIVVELSAQAIGNTFPTLPSSSFDVQLAEVVVKGQDFFPFIRENQAQDPNQEENSTREKQEVPLYKESDPLSLIFDKSLLSQFEIETKKVKDAQIIRAVIPANVLQGKAYNTLEFILVNPFPQYTLTVQTIVISDNKQGSELVPLHPISTAQNAIVEFNGIDLERNSNIINDILPGVTLTLKRADPTQSIDISISNNTEVIKNDIITFIGSYNQTIQNLEIHTRTDEIILDRFQFQSDSERDKAEENLGIFSNEFGLTRLINNLQSVTTDQYNNVVNSNITALKNIGIASNIASNTQVLASSKYLDIDESVLDKAIADDADAVAALFGADTNNDIVIDYGVAFKMVTTLTPYVQANGFVSQKQKTINDQIQRNERDLVRYNNQIAIYEQEIRRRFGNMEQIVNELNSSSSAIRGLTQQRDNN